MLSACRLLVVARCSVCARCSLVVCCLLRVVLRSLLLNVLSSLSHVRCVVFVVRWRVGVTCWLWWCDMCRLGFDACFCFAFCNICGVLCGVCCSLNVVCCLLFAKCRVLLVVRCALFVACCCLLWGLSSIG